jgi:hypothetical protein
VPEKPNNPFPVKYFQNNITGRAKKQKSGAARSASRLTAQAVRWMNCSAETLLFYPLPSQNQSTGA